MKREEAEMEISVFELRLKVYTLVDINLEEVLLAEAEYIDSAFALDDEWLRFHENNEYKNYTFSGLYPLAKDGIYKKDNVYTITIRTVDSRLEQYMRKTLANHYTDKMKGLTITSRIIPKKFINQLYTLTPVIQKYDGGYWKKAVSIDEYEKRLFANAVKKYNAFTGEKIDEDFQLYNEISFINKKPVKFPCKGIVLLGDKINLKIADNKLAQELAYFLTGTGLGETNSRGAGFCNYRWL